jgi:Secretion system C-terminal sorting domain
MKQFIHKSAFAICLLVANHLPQKSTAQCLCEGGLIPDSVVQAQYFDSITSINTSINFAQFTASVGTLSCMKLSSVVTTVLNFDLFNKEAFPDTYLFESFRRSRFSGPTSFTTTVSSPTVEYGPYDLAGIDPMSSLDEVHVGPDTVFNAEYNEKYHAGAAAYIGSGNVTFDYLNTSTTTLLDGSSNYDLFVRGYTRLNVQLVYYYCPAAILASNIKNFSAVKKDKSIQLNWLVDNEEATNTYEILISKDGRVYTSIGRAANGQISEGNIAAYTHQVGVSQVTGKLYFRIKQTNVTGKALFSPIRIVSLDENGGGTFGIYPNPVVRNVTLQFDRELKGNYKVEMVNLLGQSVYSRIMYLNGQPVIQVQLDNQPAPGVYYVRVKSTETGQLFTNKLVIQH